MDYKYVFLSHIISEKTPSYGNRDNVKIIPKSSIKEGETANSFSLYFSTNHIGTHIDFPFHFYNNGKKIMDVDTNYWIYNNIGIIDIHCSPNYIIGVDDIAKFELDKNIEILFIRTDFERYRGTEIYWKNNPGIEPKVADYFRSNFPKLRTIGFDFISLTSFQNRELGKKSHLAFLNESKGFISIVEDVKLSNYKNELMKVIVMPFLLEGVDSVPVTVMGKIELKGVL